MKLSLHTLDTAPPKAKPLLEASLKAFGMVPNLSAVMAHAPPLLEAYQNVHGLFEQTSFDEEQRTVIWQTVNVEHECHYCVPAHTAIATMRKVDSAVIEALRRGTPLPTAKLEVLRKTTLALVRERGRLTADQQGAFVAAGFDQTQLLELVLGIAQKVMSNFVNHLADTPVDAPFAKFPWSPPRAS